MVEKVRRGGQMIDLRGIADTRYEKCSFADLLFLQAEC